MDCCCRLLRRVLLAISRALNSIADLKNAQIHLRDAVSGVMLQTVPDLRRKKQAWREMARHPCCSGMPLLLGRITLLSALVRACSYVDSECAPTRRVPSTSLSLAGWPGHAGKRGTRAATTIPSFRSYRCYPDFTFVQPMDRDYLTCLT